MDNTCIICLEDIKQAKRLKCGHIFHLNCLRRWLETNVQCPTCRDKIELDEEGHAAPGRAARQRDRARMDPADRRRQAMMRRLDIPPPPPLIAQTNDTPTNPEESK